MITLTREEAQQVLDAFEVATTHFAKDRQEILAAREILRTELTKPEPEPVAWTVGGLITDFSRDFSAYKTKTYTQPLYTTPPQRKPEPEPVAWLNKTKHGTWSADALKCEGDEPSEPLYTTPQREWQGLTDAEVEKVFFDMGQFAKIDLKTFARAIEAKLKEKNT